MRDDRIDFLRFIGLSMIILAHIKPPEIIFQLRNFDVPLMVIVAGLSFHASFRQESYISYLWARTKRLVFPVWIFLSTYFLFIYLTGYPMVMPAPKTMLSSYLLLNGIGYVWIIRVFLLVAIVAPFIYSYSRKQPSNFKYFSIAAIIYLAYELLLAVCMPLPQSPLATLVGGIFLYIVPYATVFAIGLRLPDLTLSQVRMLGVVAFGLFIVWVGFYWITLGEFVPTYEFKYPPQSYYLAYAVFISSLLWMASGKFVEELGQLRLLPAMRFIGGNSIWIYLWHIPFVEIVRLPFPLNYLLVYAVAVMIAWIQAKLVKDFVLPSVANARLKKNLRLSLTG